MPPKYPTVETLNGPVDFGASIKCVCGALMWLRRDPWDRAQYQCDHCGCTHMAKKNGQPRGYPADKETRRWRVRAHKALDQLWQDGKMTRTEAYRWLAEQMEIKEHECHIAMFDKDQCRRAVGIIGKVDHG